MTDTGRTIKETREAMGISLEEVSKDLDIPVLTLEQIEAGALGAFDDIYKLKEMMIEYAKYLGLNTDEVEKKFNEYMFDYTSKIQISDIEQAIKEQEKEEDDPDRIASPYTMYYKKEKTLPYILCGIIIVIIVVLAVVWSIAQIASNNTGSDVIGLLG